MERLYASLRLLEIDCGLSIDEMQQLTLDTLARNLPTESADVDWQIMHDVSRGPLSLYSTVFPDGGRPTVSINCWPLIKHMGRFAANYTQGVDVAIVAQPAIPATMLDPKAKTRSRAHYQLALLQGARIGAGVWPLLVDSDGYLAEGPGWNLFLVKDGTIYSPEPRNILLGVSRDTVSKLAAQIGVPFESTNLGRYEALQADEMFCTATTFCVVHAKTFEGQPVGNGERGPIVAKLQQAWTKFVGVDFIAQAQEYARRLPDWEKQEIAARENQLIVLPSRPLAVVSNMTIKYLTNRARSCIVFSTCSLTPFSCRPIMPSVDMSNFPPRRLISSIMN